MSVIETGENEAQQTALQDEELRPAQMSSLGVARASGARLARSSLKKPGVILALIYIILVLICAIDPGLFAAYGINQIVPADKLQAPSTAHLLGTDELGRDLLSRMIYATRPSIEAMLIAVGLGAVIGLATGVISGFMGGWIDSLFMRAIDVLLAIPGLLLALVIVTAIGFGTVHVALAVGVGIIPGFARITRAEVLRVRNLPYVEAARTSGATLPRVLWRHVLPNSWNPVLVLIVLDLGTAILAISALSFLGFGPQPPSSDLGSLVADGREYLETSPWLAIYPGLAVGLLVFALNHIGKTLEDRTR